MLSKDYLFVKIALNFTAVRRNSSLVQVIKEVGAK
jgi:hypothetical protein